jgi:hypothetical protein
MCFDKVVVLGEAPSTVMRIWRCGNATGMGERMNEPRISARKPLEKETLSRPRRRWKPTLSWALGR